MSNQKIIDKILKGNKTYLKFFPQDKKDYIRVISQALSLKEQEIRGETHIQQDERMKKARDDYANKLKQEGKQELWDDLDNLFEFVNVKCKKYQAFVIKHNLKRHNLT